MSETVAEVLSSHGLCLGEVDEQGLPVLDVEDAFQSTFPHVSLVVGEHRDLGTGTLHTSVRYVSVLSSRVACQAIVPMM